MMAKTHHNRVNKKWFINTYMDSQEFPVNQCVFSYIFDLMYNLSFFLFDLNIVGLSVPKENDNGTSVISSEE